MLLRWSRRLVKLRRPTAVQHQSGLIVTAVCYSAIPGGCPQGLDNVILKLVEGEVAF